MTLIRKRIRTYYWLTQSLLARYKKHIIVGFFVGIALVLGTWKILPTAQAMFFPKTRVIGMVGNYEPSKLPMQVQKLISAGFTTVTEQGEAEALLASKWDVSEDGKRYFFYLKPNRYWHDGTEFTAFDVNYKFSDVVISAADRMTLKVELEEPFAPLPSHLSRPLFKAGLAGLGPYEVIDLELIGPNVKRILLKPHDDRTTAINESAGRELVDIKFYSTLDDAILAFQLGEIDMLENLHSTKEFSDYPNVTITPKVQYDRFMGIFFNNKHELLKEKELRQALSFAAPAIEGTDAVSPISITSWSFNANIKDYKHNMETAKTLFDKSGVGSGSAELELTTFPNYLDIAEQISQNWNSLGIKTTIRVVQAFPSEFDTLLGVQEIPSDPDQYPLWHSTQATNITGYQNDRIDKLLEEGRKKTDRDERLSIYRDFQKYLVEDVPAHFLIHPTVYTVTRK